MNEYITQELVEATYLFCVKRISNTEAAKDLSQDILYEALRVIASGKQFVSFYSWYWKMARNQYADYVARKHNRTLPIESAGGMAAEHLQPIENIIAAEDISQLHFALSRLTSMHREIMIRFYLKEQTVRQIAKELAVPEGTVKRRLFDAKKQLKERFDHMNDIGKSAYAPAEVDWFWGYSAMKASVLMDSSKICPQVMVICRNEAKTVNEIADEMGVAPVYLEEILEKMSDTDLLISPVKGKFLANCCVFPKEAYLHAKVYANQIFHDSGFAEKITETIAALQDQITALDFYGNHFDYSYLMWILCVAASNSFGIASKEHYLATYRGKLADEAERQFRLTMQYVLPDECFDGSIWENLRECNWSGLHQNFTTSEYGYLTFVNDYEMNPFPDEPVDNNSWRRGRDSWVDGNNISLLVSLSREPHKTLSVHEEAIAADLLKNGLLKKTTNGLIVQLPIMKRDIYDKICETLYHALQSLAEEFADLVSEGVEQILLPYVRKDLMRNFVHWDMLMFFQPTGALFYHCWNDCLAQPDDYNTSAAGLYILKE